MWGPAIACVHLHCCIFGSSRPVGVHELHCGEWQLALVHSAAAADQSEIMAMLTVGNGTLQTVHGCACEPADALPELAGLGSTRLVSSAPAACSRTYPSIALCTGTKINRSHAAGERCLRKTKCKWLRSHKAMLPLAWRLRKPELRYSL